MDNGTEQLNVEGILRKAIKLERLNRNEIIKLLSINNENDLQSLYATACSLRNRYFQNKVFLYGFVYLSTYCRNSCTFCAYRHTNRITERYRRTPDEIWETILN